MLESLFQFMRSVNIPVWLVIPVLSIITFIFSPFGTKVMEILYQKGKTYKKKPDKDYLVNHPFFDFMDYCITQRIKALNFGNKFKNNVFKDILIVEYSIYRKEIAAWIKNAVKIGDKFGFKESTKELLDKTVELIHREWLALQIPKFEPIEADYYRWQAQSFYFANNSTIKTLNSDIYDNNLERIEAILLIFQTFFELKMIDVESGLREINGKYRNEKYVSKML